jgi:hypothetical protein
MIHRGSEASKIQLQHSQFRLVKGAAAPHGEYNGVSGNLQIFLLFSEGIYVYYSNQTLTTTFLLLMPPARNQVRAVVELDKHTSLLESIYCGLRCREIEINLLYLYY